MILRAAVLSVAGLLVLAGCGGDDDDSAASSPSVSPSASPAASPSASAAASGALSAENLIRERLYFDVTGHSFTKADPDPKQALGPCTGESLFADALPVQGLTQISSRLLGAEDGLHVIEQLAQMKAPNEARTAADEIVSLVDECAAISGGDFGYGDPVTVVSEADRKVVYFPAYDSDRAFGGYVVFSVGSRVGVIDVADTVSVAQVAKLAEQAATIAGD